MTFDEDDVEGNEDVVDVVVVWFNKFVGGSVVCVVVLHIFDIWENENCWLFTCELLLLDGLLLLLLLLLVLILLLLICDECDDVAKLLLSLFSSQLPELLKQIEKRKTIISFFSWLFLILNVLH